MANVGARIGLTLKLFKSDNFQMIKPELFVEDINDSGSDEEVKARIARAVEVSKWTYDAVATEMNKLIAEQRAQLEKEAKGAR